MYQYIIISHHAQHTCAHLQMKTITETAIDIPLVTIRVKQSPKYPRKKQVSSGNL